MTDRTASLSPAPRCRGRARGLLVCAWLLAPGTLPAGEAATGDASAIPLGAQLEADGAVIGRIVFDRQNVFDTSMPEEDKALYRLANRWHMVTRERVLRQQLLIASGDRYRQRLVNESERLLRENNYLYDASIRAMRYEEGVVDLRVTTRDLWTLMPGFSISRSGGENRARVSLSEQNLLGLGTRVRMSWTDDVDRESLGIEYGDRNLGDSWVSLYTRLEDNSDGARRFLYLERPFYALDARWSGGLRWGDIDEETQLYELGDEVAEYRQRRRTADLYGGWSDGLRAGWVKRYTVGLALDDRRFTETAERLLPQRLPADRELFYPYLEFELLEDRYQTTSNRDQIDRTEDFYMGTRIAARIGYASESLGSDRNAAIFDVAASTGFGSIEETALLLRTTLSGRVEQGNLVDALWHVDSRYYHQISDKSLFFMTLAGSWGRDLALESRLQLGGDNGLRGYPLRYQIGEQRFLYTIEYRYFTDWYPFRLARVGGAVFADVGRTWGDNPVGGRPLGWLRDVGIGLRLAPTRASGRDVIHVDLAFPLDGDPSIDDVQILLESKQSF